MPVLTNTYPAENQTLLPSGLMALVFDQPVKVTPFATFTFSTSAGLNFTLNLSDSRVAVVGNAVVINLNLTAGQSYHLGIPAADITDLSGNPLSSAIALDFSVASGTDTAAPILLSTAPLDGTSNWQPGNPIVLQFNEQLQAGTGNIYIHAANGAVIATFAASNAITAGPNGGGVVAFVPTTPLQYNTSYYVTIDNGAIRDMAGNAFPGISQSTTLNFTTGSDITPPNLQTLSPYPNTQVDINANIVLTYNEAVAAGAGNIVITGNNGFSESIAITDSSQVSFSGSVVTINPVINLPGYDQFFTLTLPVGLVKDTAGNASLYGSSTNFGTIHDPADVTPPVLVGSDPADNATGVDWQAIHTLTFNEMVRAIGGSGGIHIYNADGTLAADAFSIGYYANTVSFSAALQPSSSYYIVIDSGFITDVNGNGFSGISSPTTLNFSTAPMPLHLLPGQPTTTNGDVSIHPTLQLDYNEPILIGSGNIYIYAMNGSLVDTISVTDTSHVSASGNELLVTPHVTFQSGSEYYMLMDGGIAVDSHGTGSDGVAIPNLVVFFPKAVPPSLTNVSAAVKVTDTVHGATLSPNLAVQSPDSAVLTGATVQIGGWLTGDRLSVDVSGTSITAAYDGQGTLTLSGSDSLADYQSVLRRVQFVPAQENGGPRTVQWMVKDGNTSDNQSGFYQTTVTVANIPITTTQQNEASFISSVNPDGTLALQAFYAWNQDTPATYTGGFTQAMKWGSDTAGTPGGTISYYFDPSSNWTASEQQAFAAGLALWSAEANINFVRTTNSSSAQIIFTRNSNGVAQTSPQFSQSSGEGLTGGTHLEHMTSATVSIDTSVAGFGPIGSSFTTDGGYPWQALLHEEGHAIGLGHAGPYDSDINPNNIDSAQFGPFDSRLWSIMSYINPGDTNAPYYGAYPVHSSWGQTGVQDGFIYPNQATTPMELDILAAQRLYGAPTSTPLSGGQVFGFNSNISGSIRPFFDFTQNTTPIITIWDSGSGNTLDLSGYSTTSTINLNPGTFSSCDGLTNNICIAFNTAIDTFIGGSGSDNVTGNDDGDHIYGGLSNDILTGGAGNDVLSGGGGNDTLDGGGGINIAIFSGNESGYTITRNSNGSVTVAGGDGTDTLTNVELAQFSDGTVSLTGKPRNDFDGNGKGDVLWQNSDGTAAVWLLNGATLAGGNTIGNPGSASWHAIGTGDFDGDGKADILWQNSDGTPAVWLMNGTAVTGGGIPGSTNPGPAWTVLGAADFNGDGKSDILWRGSDGSIAAWLMNGSTLTGGAVVGTPEAGWSYKGTGDFDGDGKADILFQNTDGRVAIWLMNGASLSGGAIVGKPSGSFQVKAVGDFDGDGKSDILFQDATGQVAIWEMNGTTIAGGGIAGPNPGTSWTVKQAEDVNGDGKADILWQAADGSPAAWLMNGTSLNGGGIIGTNPGTSWHIVTG